MLAMMIKSLIDSPGPEPQKSLSNRLAPCILHFVICQNLSISHTCMHGCSGGIDAEKRLEIHNEEMPLILELDKLVVGFLSVSKRLRLPFPDFLTGYRWTQMNEALLSCGTPSEEEIGQILETGVVCINKEKQPQIYLCYSIHRGFIELYKLPVLSYAGSEPSHVSK